MKAVFSKCMVGTGILALFAATPGFASDEGVIKYRQSVMKAVGGHTGAIAQIAKGNVTHEDHLVGHAHALVEVSKLVSTAFKTKAIDDKTRAKAKIWDDWSEFEKKTKDFEVAAAAVAAAAKDGGSAAAGPKLKALFGTCKGCHKPFRGPKK